MFLGGSAAELSGDRLERLCKLPCQQRELENND
jgi:hypothetical protein